MHLDAARLIRRYLTSAHSVHIFKTFDHRPHGNASHEWPFIGNIGVGQIDRLLMRMHILEVEGHLACTMADRTESTTTKGETSK